jgi:hypothetical protein
MEAFTHIFFIAFGIFSLGYCAVVRIIELREAKAMLAGPTEEEPAPANRFQDFKQWVINIF